MASEAEVRRERLLPKGVPRYVRCYDNGGGSPWFCRPCLTFQDEPKAPGQCPECGSKLLPVTGGSFDRYTVVFSGRYRKAGEWFQYLAMNARPCHPQGFGQHGEHRTQIDAPSGFPPQIGDLSRFGARRIPFHKLPEECQQLALRDYRAIWGL
jgi:hypothetical protein